LGEIGFADTVSGGRLDLGIGSGYQQFEFDRFGVDLNDSHALFAEFYDVLGSFPTKQASEDAADRDRRAHGAKAATCAKRFPGAPDEQGPTVESSPHWLIMRRSAGVSWSDKALRASGRFSVTSATRSRISHSNSPVPVSTSIRSSAIGPVPVCARFRRPSGPPSCRRPGIP
jgi:hypothetical protein